MGAQAVIQAADETIEGILKRPRMYGSPEAVEFQFLLAVEFKLIALGFGARFDHREVIDNWIAHVKQTYPKPSVCYLAGRMGLTIESSDEEWEKFVGVMKAFVAEGGPFSLLTEGKGAAC